MLRTTRIHLPYTASPCFLSWADVLSIGGAPRCWSTLLSSVRRMQADEREPASAHFQVRARNAKPDEIAIRREPAREVMRCQHHLARRQQRGARTHFATRAIGATRTLSWALGGA